MQNKNEFYQFYIVIPLTQIRPDKCGWLNKIVTYCRIKKSIKSEMAGLQCKCLKMVYLLEEGFG